MDDFPVWNSVLSVIMALLGVAWYLVMDRVTKLERHNTGQDKAQKDIERDVNKNYVTHDKMIETIGLVHRPIEVAVENLNREMANLKTDFKRFDSKLDQVLMNQSNKKTE